jgi:hypothetical protein
VFATFPVPTVTTLEAEWSSATALMVTVPLFRPVTIPLGDTIATDVSLEVHRTIASATPSRRPLESITLVTNLTVCPIRTADACGATFTDAVGKAYEVDVRSVTSAVLFFASVPVHAATAKMSAVSTVLVLRFTVQSSQETPFGSPTSMACGRTL